MNFEPYDPQKDIEQSIPYPSHTEPPAPPPPPTFLESMGHGAAKIPLGLAQIGLNIVAPKTGEAFTAGVEQANREYEASRAGQGFDYGSMLGEMIPAAGLGFGWSKLAPKALTAAAGMGGAMAEGAGIGALVGGSEFQPEGGSRAINTAVGALGGAVAAPLLKLGVTGAVKGGYWAADKVRPLAIRAMPKLKAIPDIEALGEYGPELNKWLASAEKSTQENVASLANDLKEPMKAAGITDFTALPDSTKLKVLAEFKKQVKIGEVNPAQLARLAIFDMQGVKAPRSVLTGDPTQYAAEQAAMATEEGKPLMKAIHGKGGALDQMHRNISSFVKDYAEMQPSKEVGEMAQSAVEGRWTAMQDEIGRIYDGIAKEHGAKPVLLAEAEAQFNSMPVQSGAIKKMLLQAIEAPQNLELTKRLRSTVGAAAKRAMGSEKYDLLALVDAIDQDVSDSLGSDVFKVGKDAATKRFYEMQSGKIAAGINKETLGPMALVRQVRNVKEPGELEALRNVLTKDSSLLTTPQGIKQLDAGRAAWKSIQADTIGDSLLGAFDAGPQGITLDASKIKPIAPEILEVLLDGKPERIAEYNRLVNMAKMLGEAPKGKAIVQDQGFIRGLLNRIHGFFVVAPGSGVARASASAGEMVPAGRSAAATVEDALSGKLISDAELTRAISQKPFNALMPYAASTSGTAAVNLMPQRGR